KTVLDSVDLDPCVGRYVQCPRCYALYPTSSDWPDLCTHKEAPGSTPCNAKLTRIPRDEGGENSGAMKEKRQPITQWLGRFLCRPEIEDLLDRRKAEFVERSKMPRNPDQLGLVSDVLESEIINGFTWPDGKRFYECPDDEFRLIFSLSGDGFNPFSNKEAKQTPQNVYLAGVIPGPGKPSTSQINHHTSLIVDDFVRFWETGVRYTRTTRRKDGLSVRAATAPVLCDALGSRQLCGYGSPTSTFFCTFCWLRYSDIENFDAASWPVRDCNEHRYWAELWEISDANTRQTIFEDHGIRYTPLLRLPYFDPVQHIVVDSMHNLYLGLLQRHCRSIWGMDFSMEDGDGSSRPRATMPKLPSPARMAEGRQALEFNDIPRLTSLRTDVLFYLCVEMDLRRGGRKKDFLRELIQWRVAHLNFEEKEEKKTVVLGKLILSAVGEDREKTMLPRWVDPAPARVGQKKQGKLSADQWRSFCTVHLVISLIRLWGNLPKDSRWYQMLTNFLDLVTAVEIAGMLVTSPEHISAYTTSMTRYLINMKALYKEAVVVPNHHFALHIPDYLRLWGPGPQNRGFGFERFNYKLQQIRTNKRFGEIETTYMFTATRMANLLSLLSLDKVRGVVRNMYARIQKYLGIAERGTRSHDVSPANKSGVGNTTSKPGKRIKINDTILSELCQLLNDTSGKQTYVPSGGDRERTKSQIFLHPSAEQFHALHHDGVTYRPLYRSHGDSNILLKDSASTTGITYKPARILQILAHTRKSPGDGFLREIFCVIQYLNPLPNGLIEQDWFRRFGVVGGSLWTRDYGPQIHVIRPSAIVCHFARTPMDLEEIPGLTFHVLPLDRVSNTSIHKSNVLIMRI
ncbi:hypothetical protein DFP72DRAFT_811306, partial [Ephemerocybe angulata]